MVLKKISHTLVVHSGLIVDGLHIPVDFHNVRHSMRMQKLILHGILERGSCVLCKYGMN